MFIVDSVISEHLPHAYTEIDDVITKSERNPKRAAALARARGRIAAKLNESGAPVSLAYLRLFGILTLLIFFVAESGVCG
jgi:hypothetical protein